MVEDFICPRRGEGPTPAFLAGQQDSWRPAGICSCCGSISPTAFFAAVERGEKIGPTDKGYKAYVGENGRRKFYFQHLSEQERDRFIETHNAKKMTLGYPGHFYVRPFFCAAVEAAA